MGALDPFQSVFRDQALRTQGFLCDVRKSRWAVHIEVSGNVELLSVETL